MIGLALVTTMAVLGASAKDSVDEAIAEQFRGDLVVSNVVGTPFSTSVADRIQTTPGVGTVTRIRYGVGEVHGGRQGLVGVSRGSFADVVALDMVAGAAEGLDEGTVLVSQSQAEADGLAVGDPVDWTMPAGPRGYTVAGIFVDTSVVPFPTRPPSTRCARRGSSGPTATGRHRGEGR